MIVLKEIKQKDYLKGTKVLKIRHYLGAVFVAAFVLPGIPLYYQYQKAKPHILEEKKKKQEAEIEKARDFFELKSMLYSTQKDLDPNQRQES